MSGCGLPRPWSESIQCNGFYPKLWGDILISHLLLFVCPSAHMGQGLGLTLLSFEGGGKPQNDKISNHRFKKIRLTRVIFSISILNLVAVRERDLSDSSLLLSRFCDLVFQGPLSVQEDWIKHLQRHIMNTSVPHTGLGMVEVTSQPTTLKTDQDSSLTATNAAS